MIKIAGQVLLGIALVTIAYFLLKFLLLPAIVVSAFIAFFKRSVGSGFLNVAKYLYTVALSIDQLGNVICADLFNLTLIKKDGVRFGNPDETVSSCLGKNKLKGTLTKTGKVLDWILDKLDPNHSIKSIEEDE